jgi:hypothetical protein
MGILGTALIYGIIGLVVAVAMALQRVRTPRGRRVVLFVAAALFWPLFAPLLLAGRDPPAGPVGPPRSPKSDLERRVEQTQARLLSAMARLDGAAELALTSEVDRVRALGGALLGMANRVAEIETLLASPELDRVAAESRLNELLALGSEDSRVGSARARLRNIDRLRGIETTTREDLERALLELEEMSSQLLLLKFAGSDGEVLTRIRQIAETVESITEGLIAVG